MASKITPSPIDTAFLLAVEKGDRTAVRKALADGANINALTSERINALLVAVDNGDLAMAEFLLDQGVSTEVVHSGHSSAPPLRVAAIHKNLPMVELLLSKGVNPNWPPREDVFENGMDKANETRGFLALHQAAVDGSLSIAKTLLAGGADLHIQTRMLGRPLYYAVVNGNPDIVASLLVNGANPNGDQKMHPPQGEVVYHQQSVLFNLLDPRQIPTLRMCLDAGADIDRRNEKGQTIEQVLKEKMGGREAVWDTYQHYRKMPQLTDEVLAGLDKQKLFAPNADGLCLLDSPSTWRRFAEVEQALVRRGEPLEPQDLLASGRDGNTWLHRAAQCFALAPALDCYVRGGGRLAAAFLNQSGKASPLLATALGLQQEGVVMDNHLWTSSKAPPADLRSVYQAIPPEQRGYVRNYNALSTQLRQNEPRSIGR
jgi:ankyrin repeat protein